MAFLKKEQDDLRPQWRSRIDLLITELQKNPSVLRLAYLGENETESEVDDRLAAVEELISERWKALELLLQVNDRNRSVLA